MPFALDVARALEEGVLDRGAPGLLAGGLSRVWGRLAGSRLVRPLPRPAHVRLVVVGGATLGGSGKTPVAIACVRWLAEAGARVAFVGHAYGAAPGRARVVSSHDPLEEVGDEALVAALALAGTGAPVVVGRTRREGVALASTFADVVVVDGVSQARPRAALALLALDARRPWGRACAVPPRGDLRAPVSALMAAADLMVRVGDEDDDAVGARVVSAGAWVCGELRTWESLRRLRVGVITALARPERVLRSLARNGVVPTVVVRGPDHGPVTIPGEAASAVVDLWLTTPKCALHAWQALRRLSDDDAYRAGPERGPSSRTPCRTKQVLAVLNHTLVLGPAVTCALTRLDPANERAITSRFTSNWPSGPFGARDMRPHA